MACGTIIARNLSPRFFDSEIVSFALATLRRFGRTHQKENVFAFGELDGGYFEQTGPHFEGIELPHGPTFEFLFRAGWSHVNFPAIVLPIEGDQDQLFDGLAL